jgi:CDGSH iron-sulfur domain-containing protein 3
MSASSKKQPYVVELGPGSYYWCACGRSKRQPYCDGSHRGACSPIKLEQGQAGPVRLCGCKESASKPYCDCEESTETAAAGPRER